MHDPFDGQVCWDLLHACAWQTKSSITARRYRLAVVQTRSIVHGEVAGVVLKTWNIDSLIHYWLAKFGNYQWINSQRSAMWCPNEASYLWRRCYRPIETSPSDRSTGSDQMTRKYVLDLCWSVRSMYQSDIQVKLVYLHAPQFTSYVFFTFRNIYSFLASEIRWGQQLVYMYQLSNVRWSIRNKRLSQKLLLDLSTCTSITPS